MKFLRHQNRFFHSENFFGTVAGIVSVPSGKIFDDIFRRNTEFDGCFLHHGGFVVIFKTIVAAHQNFSYPSGTIKFDRRDYAVI